jgi:ribosomal protein S18 acetylase RimI-like enzyme
MYDSLFEENKRFFHPGFLGFESVTLNWLFAQFALAASSFAFFKKLLLRVYPFAVLLTIVSTNKSGEIIGFAFVKRKSHSLTESFLGELGICVADNYQGKHVGSELMDYLLKMAKNDSFKRIYLTVLADNIKAISMYEKYGFKMIRLTQKGDVWRGKRFDFIEMRLNLN